ncbi:MAG TPA: ParA family protein [Firmicutes bacterium]|uniref:Sporulation initiation inhibitor protein Soj n=1 Tax=Capillibacterium thermochitinicola TaxID=2699427 RepID=A0A8J6I020_9FIRM|nr:AAA family ATPase [Capillibacterium thermochitinicola]MBA2133225.1 ParA family protein [Capillibacterium thermochitinicola]HHW12199.1 ParA family protein [Bacillota bacterium]
MGKVFAITNQKGGVGKTTTAVNLGAYLAVLGKKVLVLDNDPQGNATSGLGLRKSEIKKCIYDVLVSEIPIEEVILPTQVPNLWAAPATIRLAGAEAELVGMMARDQRLRRSIEPVRQAYDYILIDCPPSLGNLTLNALAAADAVIVPIQCEYYALEGLSQLMKTLQLVQKYSNPSLEVEGVVLTMYDHRTNLSQQVAEEVRNYFQDRVYNSVIPRNIRLSEAPSHGLPINLYDNRSKGAEAYFELAKEVIARE